MRYYFDCFDGNTFVRDVYGVELTDLDEVVEQASVLTRTLLNETTGSYGNRSVMVVARLEDGKSIYIGSGVFHGLLLDGAQAEEPATVRQLRRA